MQTLSGATSMGSGRPHGTALILRCFGTLERGYGLRVNASLLERARAARQVAQQACERAYETHSRLIKDPGAIAVESRITREHRDAERRMTGGP